MRKHSALAPLGRSWVWPSWPRPVDRVTAQTADGEPIRVASFNFNESVIVAEIYAQGLEANGYTVERQLNLGNREVVKPALESGEIDLVPEYTGTVAGFLGVEASADSDATWEAASAAWEELGVTLLAYSPAQDKNAYVVTAETAEEFSLTSVSDLQPVAGEMIFGGPPECPERPLCLQGLQDVYGLEFAEFVPLDVGGPITIAALEGGEIDVGSAVQHSGDHRRQRVGVARGRQGPEPCREHRAGHSHRSGRGLWRRPGRIARLVFGGSDYRGPDRAEQAGRPRSGGPGADRRGVADRERVPRSGR